LLDVLAGRVRADRGSLRICGRPLASWSTRQLARQRAFLPQASMLAFDLRVRDLVALGRSPYRSAAEARFDEEAIETALRLTDAWALRDRFYQLLSGGERQRVQLARVIAQIWRPTNETAEPRLLLLDEPTASLDPGHRLAVMRMLRELTQHGIGVLVALHDLNDALRFADQAILLEQGCLRRQGDVADVLDTTTLTAVYGAKAEILRDRDGQPVLIFS
jgi:iron complex transport system ATP-binding protein